MSTSTWRAKRQVDSKPEQGMHIVFNTLVSEASRGSVPALSQLIFLSFSANIFIATRAKRTLRDHFNIKSEN